MVNRMLVTAVVPLLALGAFWGNALDAGRFFNPFGILLLFLAVVVWLMSVPLRDGFIAAKNESNIPIIRMGSAIIRVLRPSQRRSTSASGSSS
jgi:hypothetical protein